MLDKTTPRLLSTKRERIRELTTSILDQVEETESLKSTKAIKSHLSFIKVSLVALKGLVNEKPETRHTYNYGHKLGWYTEDLE